MAWTEGRFRGKYWEYLYSALLLIRLWRLEPAPARCVRK